MPYTMGVSSPNPLLFVPIETKVREFHGKLLFSLAAVEKGFDVILGGQQAMQKQLHKFDRGVYMDKSIAVTRKKWFKRCRAMGNIVTSWDEEGLVYFDDPTYWELRICEEALAQTSSFIAWGEELKKTIVAKVPDASSKITLGGNPRFDMLRPELREFFRGAADKITRQYGRIIQVNTNFGFCNHFKGVESCRKTLTTYPIAQSHPGFFEGWIEAQEKMFTEFKKMIPKLSKEFPDHTIILRPHPSENHRTWEKLTAEFGNVVVNSEGNVLEWIMASDVLVHFNCTTAIESYLMDVPAIAYKAVRLGFYEQNLPNALSYEALNCEALLSMVTGFVDKTTEFIKTEEQEKIARKFITGVDGTFSADRIADNVKRVALPGKSRRTITQKAYTIWRDLWLFVRSIKETNLKTDYYDIQKFPGIELDELRDTIATLQDVSGRFNGIETKPVGDRCFLLFAK